MRLIDADKLKEDFNQDDWGQYLDSDVRRIIDEAPTVETGHYLTNCQNCQSDYSRGYDDGYKEGYKAERPTGKWIEEIVPRGLVGTGNGQYRCSNCHHGDIHAKTQEVPFCWYCGAIMDKKGAEE